MDAAPRMPNSVKNKVGITEMEKKVKGITIIASRNEMYTEQTLKTKKNCRKKTQYLKKENRNILFHSFLFMFFNGAMYLFLILFEKKKNNTAISKEIMNAPVQTTPNQSSISLLEKDSES